MPVALPTSPLYHHSIFSPGLPLLVFFLNLLVTGWSVGLAVSAMVLHYGPGAAILAGVALCVATLLFLRVHHVARG